MAKERKPILGIPMERTVIRERPGRWMPVVWLLFAVALTVGIIAAVQTFVPIDPKDRANSTLKDIVVAPVTEATPSPPTTPPPATPAPSAPPVEVVSTPPPPAPSPSATVEEAPVPSPTTAPARPSPTIEPAAPEPDAFPPGSNATLNARTQAEWRDGGRSTGVTYLPPGTPVVVDERLPDGKYRVHWREAEASVALDVLVPVVP